MFVVTVTFVVKESYVDAFETVVRQQAANSLTHEPDCRQFDVCMDPSDRSRVFLYEVYTNREAFEKKHLTTEYFLEFDRRVKGWLLSKTAEHWERLLGTR